MIEIINKLLLLHLVGYLYYWQMGFNSVFKGLMEDVKWDGMIELCERYTSMIPDMGCLCSLKVLLSAI